MTLSDVIILAAIFTAPLSPAVAVALLLASQL